MRMPAPREKIPVTPRMLSGLALPFLWALVYPVDRVVLFFHVEGACFQEVLSLLTAVAIFTAMIFSPRDDIVPWETVPEPRQRRIFFVACGVSLAGVALLAVSGGDFWTYINLALAVLTLLWLVLPYLVLSGNEGALRPLLFAMRMGMVWWTSMFFILLVKDGAGAVMDNSLPVGALAFLGATYWWFLMTVNRLLSDEAGERPLFSPGWKKRYWLGLALSGCLVLLWVFTGFTNDGEGRYGAASYLLSYPFYDVAAILEPFAFSNGQLLLLHSIPWQKIFLPGGAASEAGLRGLLSGLHWMGLSCLAVAVLGAFGAFLAGMFPRLTAGYGMVAFLVSAATAFQVVLVWREFASQGVKEADRFMLMGQHVPALACCAAAMLMAACLVVMTVRAWADGQAGT